MNPASPSRPPAKDATLSPSAEHPDRLIEAHAGEPNDLAQVVCVGREDAHVPDRLAADARLRVLSVGEDGGADPGTQVKMKSDSMESDAEETNDEELTVRTGRRS